MAKLVAPRAERRQRPTDRLRQASVVGCVLAGLVSGATGDYGDAEGSDSLLVPADWAFGIWGPVYAGSLAYAAYQARPSLAADPELRRVGWPAAGAYLGAGLWVRTAQRPGVYVSVVAATTLAATVAHARLEPPAASPVPGRSVVRQWMVRRPIGALAGWLTLASAVSTVEPAARLLGRDVARSEQAWALPALAATAALVVTRSVRAPVTGAYPLAVAWGLAGTAARQREPAPGLAAAASVAAAALGLLAAAGTLTRAAASARRPARPSRPRPG